MPISSNRPLWRALALSLLIHAVLLVGVVSTVPLRVEQSAGPLSAELRRPQESVAMGPVAAPTPPAGHTLPAPQRPAVLATTAPVPEPRAVAEPALPTPAALPAPPAVTAASAAASAKSDRAVNAPNAASAAANRVAAEGAAAGAGNPGVNADDLRQYRMSLASNAARFKHYPPLARERGWEGTADVALEHGPLLPAPQVTLAHSSGRRVIDDQAVEMVREAARVTGLPEGLKGRDFRVRFPVVFSLEDGPDER